MESKRNTAWTLIWLGVLAMGIAGLVCCKFHHIVTVLISIIMIALAGIQNDDDNNQLRTR
jgi:hypothetical protein